MKFIRPNTILDTGAFTRASTATFVGSDGLIQSASNNVPRINYDPVTLACKGYLAEAAATNLLLNSLLNGTSLSTQSVTVSAVPYTLSFYGTGTVTLSGTHAFAVVGTGAYPARRTYTFTPTAGTLTLTVTGTVQFANLETGAAATSFIPTAGVAATRAADTITGAGLVYCNLPETDYAAWVSGTTYAANDRVIRTTTHSVYQRAVAGAGTTPPETDTTNWVRIGPTNRWAPFDEKVGTAATNASVITYLLKPGRLNGLALLGVVAGKATVSLVVNNETVYTASVDLDSGNTVGNWYEYFYEPIYQQGELVITDLLDAALFDVPGYSEGVLSVTLERPSETVSCGMLVVGIASDIGLTQYGARVSVRDYSKKDADSFGNYTLTVGEFSKRMTADVIVDNDKLDNVVNYLTRYRATNLVWVGSSVYGCTVIYGFLADWSVQIENATQSRLSQEIEGMT